MIRENAKEQVNKDWIVKVKREVITEFYVSAPDEDEAELMVCRGKASDQLEISETDFIVQSVTENK